MGKTYRFLELLWNTPRSVIEDPFERLMSFLEAQGQSWLCDEMRADVLADRGELDIEDYIYREAATLVHR